MKYTVETTTRLGSVQRLHKTDETKTCSGPNFIKSI